MGGGGGAVWIVKCDVSKQRQHEWDLHDSCCELRDLLLRETLQTVYSKKGSPALCAAALPYEEREHITVSIHSARCTNKQISGLMD